MSSLPHLHTPPRLGDDLDRIALLVDGVVQSISPDDSRAAPGYWGAMIPPLPPKRALILGLGGGTLAHLLARQCRRGTLAIVGVDADGPTLSVARAAGWLLPEEAWRREVWREEVGWPAGVTLDVVEQDAFEYVANDAPGGFDYVALDLYQGNDLVTQSLTRPFVRQLLTKMEPRGWLAINLFRDAHARRRTRRLARELIVRQEIRVGSNVIVHAQNR